MRGRHGGRRVAAIVVSSCAGTLVIGDAAAWAQGRITPYPERSATPVAEAIVEDRRVLKRAIFSAVPPTAAPAAVSTKRLAGFPIDGPSFGILTNGNAKYADGKNRSGRLGDAALGPIIRGARDVTIMRIYLRVPSGANCLSIRFRFLSEEFPEFVNDIFNDAFIAELDRSSWDASGPADPTITAPRNFAADVRGNPIRVNTVGDASVSRNRARGTTYDAATRRLRASTRITPGGHSLYLSIFDQGDRDYDSAVFLDQLTVDRRSPCRSGAVPEGA